MVWVFFGGFMQELITIDGIAIKQPDAGLGYDFETTYSKDSTRTQDGIAHFTPLFTVERFSYSATLLTKEEMKTILQLIAGGRYFTLHYFSPYFCAWREDTFYVGKGSLSIGRLNENAECFDDLSFNMIGVNPID